MRLAIELIPGALQLTSKTKCQSNKGAWGPQKAYFQASFIYYYGPTDFAPKEAKKCSLIVKINDHGREMVL